MPKFDVPNRTQKDLESRLNFAAIVAALKRAIGPGPYLSVPIVDALPTASAEYAGTLLYWRRASGTEESVFICRKQADDSYIWKSL